MKLLQVEKKMYLNFCSFSFYFKTTENKNQEKIRFKKKIGL